MIRRDVQQHPDGGCERWGEVDLKRRTFDDVRTIIGRRLQRQDRGADVATHLHVAAGFAQNVRHKRGRGGFAIRAGDGNEGSIRRDFGALAAEQFDVADDLHAGATRQRHRPVRLGMGQRHTERKNET